MKKLLLILLCSILCLTIISCGNDNEGNQTVTATVVLGGWKEGSVFDFYHLYVDYTFQTPQGTESKTVNLTAMTTDLKVELNAPCSFKYKCYYKKQEGKEVDPGTFYSLSYRATNYCHSYIDGTMAEAIKLTGISSGFDAILGYDLDKRMMGINHVFEGTVLITVDAEGKIKVKEEDFPM